MKLGYHVSTAGGLNESIKVAKFEKLTAIQIFAGSPRTYFPSKHALENINSMKNIGIPVFVHSNYLINLADNKPVLPKAIADNLLFCDSIGAKGLVIHMGSNADKQFGKDCTLYNIKRAYEKTNADTKILIETTAEGGNRFLFSDIIEFLNNNSDLNVGMCFDTAHMYAAGYNVLEYLVEYKDKINLVHLNNPCPEVEFGRHLDRHNISLFDKTGKFSEKEILDFIKLCDESDISIILETGYPSEDILICEKLNN
jgi:deoxyribonuclease-4